MHEFEVNVRFSETDALGHINNTSYFIYLEETRMKFFEALGLAMKVESWNFLLASTKCDFIAQGYFNQLLTIRSSLTKVGTKSCEMVHDILCSQTGEVIAKGSAVLVCFNFLNQNSEPIPEMIKEKLISHLVHN
ncbi:acyl-CoA thioesterase [Peribacillus sp. NJ4]|uniref:acyl-CoA thioesterase n=1 Tax=Peribacillus sp. NJ4 TaxID=3055862 RepID=UPI0025A156C8|nr:acyl-CoA thioesterase [Peribacillus sp. NJ4]MDM5213605.1 acyl-CoA thioesterase [Peribacillus sp. NJ4]